MAETKSTDSQESENKDCSFQWDETSQLYFHASSGFYHDPSAGWYYSSSDGLYYRFEDGNYVLLGSEFNKGDECETHDDGVNVDDCLVREEPCSSVQPSDDVNQCYVWENDVEASRDDPNSFEPSGNSECTTDQMPENLPPPSEWLEETLIDLYLSGYSNITTNVADDLVLPSETEEMALSVDDAGQDCDELEEGEWIPEEDHYGSADLNGIAMDEDEAFNEEKWRAQYGQVVQSEEEPVAQFPVVDLWDWKVVIGPRKDGKGEVARLVGRLLKRSAKLHPSMPSGGGLLKTAAICQTHLDLVRVRTGQVYKLRNPNASYMTSLSSYDSSNPTKDWDFPELSISEEITLHSRCNEKIGSKTMHGATVCKDSSMLPNEISAIGKHKSRAYRDRAAERRTLHGGFGVGPGQKNSGVNDDGDPSSTVSTSTEEAAAQALNMSFGSGSYARRLLEGMGWKEGEALGDTMKGLVEPIQAVGNIGSAGLGWPQGRAKFR